MGLLTAALYNLVLVLAAPTMGALAGALVAYLLVLPLSYLGQRRYTFRSQGRKSQELPWFMLGVCVSLPATTLAFYLLREWPLGLALLAVNLVAAAVSYAWLRLRVFVRAGT